MTKTKYKPSDEEKDRVDFVYEEFTKMRQVHDEDHPEFNDRSLKKFLDDCQKRTNAYTPSRESQGKDDWQANVFTKTTRNKVKSELAAVAQTPPDISISAHNSMNEDSVMRSQVMGDMVKSSFQMYDNPEKTIFLDSWNCVVNGTVIKYDGYIRKKEDIEVVTDFNLSEGEVETKTEEDALVEDRPIEINVPVDKFYIRNPYIPDVQDQPAIIWQQFLEEEEFQAKFSEYKNADVVPTKAEMSKKSSDLFYGDKWTGRHDNDNMYEVLRYYNKQKNIYRIIVNGVEILDAPMIWGKKRKYYPFAKTIYEPFANTQFFWGNSLPNILMDSQDVENALLNSMLDKQYRALVPQMVVGNMNRDAFDLNDEWVNSDTKIYVNDVNQVKEMPHSGIDNGDLQMLRQVQNNIDASSSDQVQAGKTGSGATAREVVIANERAQELRGLFFNMMKDLWLQKVRLRIPNLLTHYSRPHAETVAGKKVDVYPTFKLEGQELSDGKIGTKKIEVVEDQSGLTPGFPLDVREQKSELQGEPLEIIQITSDYLDNWRYEINVSTRSMKERSRSMKKALISEKIQTVAKLFPRKFKKNKEQFFRELMEGFDDSPEKYQGGAQDSADRTQQISDLMKKARGENPQQSQEGTGVSPQQLQEAAANGNQGSLDNTLRGAGPGI